MFSSILRKSAGALIMLTLVLTLSPGTVRAELELEITTLDVMGLPGDQNIPVEVWIKNYTDTVAGFELWFQLGHPGMAQFEIAVDTSLSLISGWDFLDVRSVAGSDQNVKVTALADITVPFLDRGFAPQDAGKRLFTLLVSIPSEPDPYANPVVPIHVATVIEHFGFTTPQGQSLGISIEEIVDTSYFVCVVWGPPPVNECLEYEQVPYPPYDSIYIKTEYIGYVDSSKIAFVDGSATVAPVVCGNIDGSFDEMVTGADLSLLVHHLFIDLEPLQLAILGNIDGQPGGVDGTDLSWLIANLFIDFRELECADLR
ncbi:MAG: hypothetical protein DRP45_08805 [Candidatus Zixiibacteriota bacterium]|nr:MAG: hypothetical protein DRP45_08805 [candidate division Zixibacteria bacterium]